jgi:uncharacterized protein YggT (Ycf19 family)
MVIIVAFIKVINYLLQFYFILLIAAMVLNLVRADPSNPIVKMVTALTDPPCKWLKRKFPKLVVYSDTSVIDLSPTVLMLGVGAMQVFLTTIATNLSY